MAANDDDHTKPGRGTALCNRRVDGPYTVLPNSIVQGDLSPDAFRLVAYVASLPEDWSLRAEKTWKLCKLTRNRYYDALKELCERKLARNLTKRSPNGKIESTRWEFTLTPGQWKEPDGSLIPAFRKRRNDLFPENHNMVDHNMVSGTLQKTDTDKFNRKKNQQSDCQDFSSGDLSGSDGATGARPTPQTASPPVASKAGSATGELPAQWPFLDDAQATRSVRRLGVEPQAVWETFRAQALAGKCGDIKNLAGYLVTMARGMAKAAYGPSDPEALRQAREALSARSGTKPPKAFRPSRW
jgi:hypothetical protein